MDYSGHTAFTAELAEFAPSGIHRACVAGDTRRMMEIPKRWRVDLIGARVNDGHDVR